MITPKGGASIVCPMSTERFFDLPSGNLHRPTRCPACGCDGRSRRVGQGVFDRTVGELRERRARRRRPSTSARLSDALLLGLTGDATGERMSDIGLGRTPRLPIPRRGACEHGRAMTLRGWSRRGGDPNVAAWNPVPPEPTTALAASWIDGVAERETAGSSLDWVIDDPCTAGSE